MPKISVIIPVYNVKKYLAECLDSVLNQTFQDFEIICVDDGSTDNSLDILKKYAEKDKRIKIFSQKNKGLSGARNTGLENISGEYCYFLDSDDYIENDLFEYAMKVFDTFDIDYFAFRSLPFGEDDEITQSVDDMRNYLRLKRDGLFDLDFEIGLNTNIQVWSKIFKTSIIKNNNLKFIEGLLYEDIYFMWFYFFLSKKAYFENAIYHHYRMVSGSIMERTTKNKTYESGIAHMYNWYHLMKDMSKNESLFKENYENLLKLLNNYNRRTKEMVSRDSKYKVEKLKLEYLEEMEQLKPKGL